jgi:hypothetical protein
MTLACVTPRLRHGFAASIARSPWKWTSEGGGNGQPRRRVTLGEEVSAWWPGPRVCRVPRSWPDCGSWGFRRSNELRKRTFQEHFFGGGHRPKYAEKCGFSGLQFVDCAVVSVYSQCRGRGWSPAVGGGSRVSGSLRLRTEESVPDVRPERGSGRPRSGRDGHGDVPVFDRRHLGRVGHSHGHCGGRGGQQPTRHHGRLRNHG